MSLREPACTPAAEAMSAKASEEYTIVDDGIESIVCNLIQLLQGRSNKDGCKKQERKSLCESEAGDRENI